MFKNEFGFKVWSSSHERQQSGSWLPGATCELNPVFPGATWEGVGSAHIAQNHQINIPHRVAHRVSHYTSIWEIFWSTKKVNYAWKKYFRDVSSSKPSPRSKSWENGVPRIGLRIGSPLFKLVSKPSPRSKSLEISARRIGLRTPPPFVSSFRPRFTI